MSRLDWGVRAIIEHDGKLLAVKNAVEARDFYCLPGGAAETGESVYEALDREIFEELGVHPEIGDLLYVHQLSNWQNNGQRYGGFGMLFHVRNGKDFAEADLSRASHAHELTAVDWVEPLSVIFKPQRIADDWQSLLACSFSRPAVMLLEEWRP